MSTPTPFLLLSYLFIFFLLVLSPDDVGNTTALIPNTIIWPYPVTHMSPPFVHVKTLRQEFPCKNRHWDMRMHVPFVGIPVLVRQTSHEHPWLLQYMKPLRQTKIYHIIIKVGMVLKMVILPATKMTHICRHVWFRWCHNVRLILYKPEVFVSVVVGIWQ